MGGKAKKAAPKKAGGKDGDVEDKSVEMFWKTYKNKKIPEYGLEKPSPQIKELFAPSDGDKDKEGFTPDKFHLWEELGWPGVKAITDSLIAVE